MVLNISWRYGVRHHFLPLILCFQFCNLFCLQVLHPKTEHHHGHGLTLENHTEEKDYKITQPGLDYWYKRSFSYQSSLLRLMRLLKRALVDSRDSIPRGLSSFIPKQWQVSKEESVAGYKCCGLLAKGGTESPAPRIQDRDNLWSHDRQPAVRGT